MKMISTDGKTGMKAAAAAIAAVVAVLTASARRIDVHPQSFDAGGWGLDVQFMDVIGSPCLIAHGRGIRVTDATAKVTVPEAGRWRVWVRSRKWVDSAGRFKVAVGARELGRVFGALQKEWAWEDGGELELPAGESEVRLVDLDGFDGRMAGVALVKDGVAPQGPLSLEDAEIAETVEADFVVVGGGLPGTCAAVAAARRGLRVALLNDRPVLGGNASSEIRVWSGGEARYPLVKELRGWFMNRNPNMALSDANRMRIVANEKTLTAHLCMRAFAAETEGGRITAVKALDWKRNRVVRFTAPLFCDATGDGWVGYWAKADYRMGREAKDEYGESFAPDRADGDTLGASLMWTSAEANTDVPFSAPWAEEWARGEAAVNGEWNWEYGIHHDMFADGEWIRDRLLLAIYGAFSLAKKDPVNSRRVIDFLPFILGKRESRRLMGDWVLSEKDVSEKRPFEDAIASGSWSVDLHYDDAKPGVEFLTTCRQPHYGRYFIPYRSIYSRNIPNLFMAGRCFSCTHVGLGSPRVMNTLAQLGVAAGEAAAMCRRLKCDPRGIYSGGHCRKLQRILGGDFPGNPDPAKKDWRIVDNEDSGVLFNGKWNAWFCANGEQVGDKMSTPGKNAKEAVYPLPVDKTGRYRLYGRVPYLYRVKRPASTMIRIESGGDVYNLEWDQTQRTGEWIDLGKFSLKPGAVLFIDPVESKGTVVADGFAIAPDDTLSICAVGDSITQGGASFASYRVALEKLLSEKGWKVEWKGTRVCPQSGSSSPCEGYSGRNAEAVAAHYVTNAPSVAADILLLHAGHNYNADSSLSSPACMPEPDIVAAVTNAHRRIIAAARMHNPAVAVLYAQVITSGKLPKYAYIPALNRAIAGLAAELNADKSPVIAVDMANGWNHVVDCVSDKVHPSEAGAKKMAERWGAVLQGLVDSGNLKFRGGGHE